MTTLYNFVRKYYVDIKNLIDSIGVTGNSGEKIGFYDGVLMAAEQKIIFSEETLYFEKVNS